jgi:hypothetical protein
MALLPSSAFFADAGNHPRPGSAGNQSSNAAAKRFGARRRRAPGKKMPAEAGELREETLQRSDLSLPALRGDRKSENERMCAKLHDGVSSGV